MSAPPTAPSRTKVYLAFAAVYIIWGSTYFFIREALDGFPPFMLGGVRFALSAAIMFGWCRAVGTSIAPGRDLWKAVVVGLLLLFVGNGAVIWAEGSIPSSVVAIAVAVAPLSFVVFDKPNWGVNFRSPATLIGVAAGIAGVWLLFGQRMAAQWGEAELSAEAMALLILLVGIIAWPAGSLFAKYRPTALPNMVNSSWQMLTGAVCFLVVAVMRGEWGRMDWGQVPGHAWFALVYLVLFGSILGYSAYVWLLGVRPAAQVSTYAYVNPVVAVLLGVFLGNEVLGWREVAGLVVILGGVLMINLAKYRKG